MKESSYIYIYYYYYISIIEKRALDFMELTTYKVRKYEIMPPNIKKANAMVHVFTIRAILRLATKIAIPNTAVPVKKS